MKIFNTLTRQTEDFEPVEGKPVTFYQCGPTVYWTQHIGNLRAMTISDLIRRTLIQAGHRVKFVRNYTDVGHLTSDQDEGEDKMEKGAKREGRSPAEIAQKYIDIFENDTARLNIIEPDGKPRASEYIKEMQEMIGSLVGKGYAYVTGMGVVYDVSKFSGYNKLNRQKMELNIKGSGKGTVDDPEKRHPADFNLWVFKRGKHANALQTWPSPWGEGFPGWHIECSVMAKSLLGDTVDLHMGGVEHIAVHHTNEIAQSEAANGVKFVRYWLHNEHLNVDDEKMAKSQGTGFTLDEVTDRGFEPLSLRYFFLQAHYRSKQNFTWEALKAAETGLRNLREMVSSLPGPEVPATGKDAEAFKQEFREAVSSDFQFPKALAVTWEMMKSGLDIGSKKTLAGEFDKVLGVGLGGTVNKEHIPPAIMDLARKRQGAKEKGDYAESDRIRDELASKGYRIEDSPAGFRLKKI